MKILRQPNDKHVAESDFAGVHYMDGRAIINAEGADGRRYYVHITDGEIERIIKARDAYMRETRHRGYPATGRIES